MIAVHEWSPGAHHMSCLKKATITSRQTVLHYNIILSYTIAI